MSDLDTPSIRAFDRGLSAARASKPRSANPYMPSTEQELWQSWNCGFDVENGPRYRVVSAEHTTIKVAPRDTPLVGKSAGIVGK